MNTAPVIVEHVYNASAARLWKALTDVNEMRNWYFDLAAFKAKVGFIFQFTGENEGRHYVHICEITEVIPGKKLTYSWSYEGYAGKSFVSFELFEQGSKTLLKLTHSGLETFPPENKDFAVTNFEAGWDEIIHHSLKNYMETSA